MNSRRHRQVLLTTLLLLVVSIGSARSDEPVDLDKPLPVDPALQHDGRLSNGLAYWIRPHPMPKGKVMLVLHVGSGSLHEEEDQRGLAHFVEHLAFNGSANFPSGEVVRYFESIGMAFGTHQNAFTSFDQTTYMLSLPDVKPETIRRALLFLADVGHRLLLTPEEIEKERAVILEEHRARQGLGMRMMERALPMVLPGSRLASRLPGGDPEIVRTAEPERLRAYYETWYRPDRTTLIVCGDVAPTVVKPLIEKAFLDWARPSVASAKVESGIASRDFFEAGVIEDPEQTDVGISVNLVRKRSPRKCVGDYRRRLVEQLGARILNRRFERRIQEGEAAFAEASFDSGQLMVDHLFGELSLTASLDAWREALTQVVAELRRVREHGVASDELAGAKQYLLSIYDVRAGSADSQSGMGLAMRLNQAVTDGHLPMSASQRRDLAHALFPTVTAEEVDRFFQRVAEPARSFVLASVPEKEGVEVPDRAALLAAWKAAFKAPLAERKAAERAGSTLAKDPEPGEIATRSEDETLGVTSLVLANGVRVHVKPLSAVKAVQVSMSLGGGGAEEDETTRGLTEAASLAFTPGKMATQSLSPAQVTEYLDPLQVGVGGSIDATGITLVVSGPPAALADGLRLAHRLLREPRVDAASFATWKRDLEAQLAGLTVNLPMQAMLGIRRIATDGDVRFRLPTLEQYRSLDLKTVQAWLDRLVKEGPLEVSVVGGIEREDAVRLVRTYLGSLPPRPDRFAAMLAKRRVAEVHGPVKEVVRVPTVTPYAMVLLGWRGVARDRSAEQIALVHAGTILTARLLRSVREEKGLTYSIGGSYQFTNYDGMDGLLVQFAADPKKADDAADAALEVVRTFVKEGPTADEIQAAERQMVNSLEEEMQGLGFWSATLTHLHTNGNTLAALSQRLDWLRRVDVALLKKTLAEVVVDSRFACVIAAPGAKKPEPEKAPAGGG